MADRTPGRGWSSLRRSWPALVVGGGVLLWMLVGKEYLFVAGLGAFLPGILRELGWLKDHDEFQHETNRRAAHHAYLIGGLATVLIISALEAFPSLEPSIEWVNLVLVIMWLTFLFSVLLAYWGARKTTSRMLLALGSFWLVFAVASAISEADPGDRVASTLLGLMMGLAIVAPFFVLAWAATHWPRATGWLLLGVSAAFLSFFAPFRSGGLTTATGLLTTTLLIVPLVACGIALLREGRDEDEEDDEPIVPGDVGAGGPEPAVQGSRS